MDELRVMSGKPQETRLRIRKLSPKALNAKMYLRKSYNYFYSKGEPFILCYDSETKRHPKEEYYTENLVSSLCVLNFRLHFRFLQTEFANKPLISMHPEV